MIRSLCVVLSFITYPYSIAFASISPPHYLALSRMLTNTALKDNHLAFPNVNELQKPKPRRTLYATASGREQQTRRLGGDSAGAGNSFHSADVPGWFHT